MEQIASIAAIIVMVLMPIVALTVFWMVHILPERIAYKRNHPQKEAIKITVYMSLLFGGMLWPIAWIWTFLKSPRGNSGGTAAAGVPVKTPREAATDWQAEIARLDEKLQSYQGVAEEYQAVRHAIDKLQAEARELERKCPPLNPGKEI